MPEKYEGQNPFVSPGEHWRDATMPAPTRQQMVDFDARGQMLGTPVVADLAASRMAMKGRPSMSTIRTTASTVTPHPPVLPPVDTSFNFANGVEKATPQNRCSAAVAAGAVGGIAGGAAAAVPLSHRHNSSDSTTSSNRDPFATPSPSSARTGSSSSVLTKSESDLNAEKPNVPAFSFSQSSPTLPPSYSRGSQNPARPAAAAATHHTRPALVAANRTTTTSSFNPSEFSATTDNDNDDDDDADIVEAGAVAEAVMVRRAQVGERTRASVVDVPVGHSRQGSRATETGTVTGRKGSEGSEGSGIGMAQ